MSSTLKFLLISRIYFNFFFFYYRLGINISVWYFYSSFSCKNFLFFISDNLRLFSYSSFTFCSWTFFCYSNFYKILFFFSSRYFATCYYYYFLLTFYYSLYFYLLLLYCYFLFIYNYDLCFANLCKNYLCCFFERTALKFYSSLN